MRGVNLVLGAALATLGVVGARASAPAWLLSITFLIAFGTFATALAPTRSPALVRALDLGLGAALVLAWLLAIAAAVESWFAWWFFAFGVTYLIVGVSAPTIERDTTRLGRASRPSDPRHA